MSFVMVNETRNVVQYSHAAFFEDRTRELRAVSGTPDFDPDGTFARWLKAVSGSFLSKQPESHERDALAGGADNADILPPFFLSLPLEWNGHELGILLLGRHTAFSDGHELAILQRIGPAIGQALFCVQAQPRKVPRVRRSVMIAGIGLLALGCFPVHSSMIGRAEIIPSEPAQLVAPFESVVLDLKVDPNQPVKKGQVLIELDRAQIQNALSVARESLAVAETQYQEALESGVDDVKARTEIGPLQDKIESAKADVTYQASLLEKTVIRAPIDGIALFADRLAWTGKPAQTGEKILVVAPRRSRMLKIAIAPDGLWHVADSAPVVFYNNSRPEHPVHGQLISHAYAPKQLGDMSSVYEFRADLDNEAHLGDEGTGKIVGPRTLLALWIFRRPWQVIRPWL
ncbi:hypothetical protein AA0323_2699 [Asaia siamensis NRIC 0323]|nr:hypothetical protein AA0323_2699 [Asaia siamensis NRIC 0323]